MTIPGGVPPQLLSDWKAAEERLYPVVMVRPDLYERAVRMVRVVAVEESFDDPTEWMAAVEAKRARIEGR